MFSSARNGLKTALTTRSSPCLILSSSSRMAYSVSASRLAGEKVIATNDPTPKKVVPNVSATNATPVDSMGSWDTQLQEGVEEAERSRMMQAPNRPSTWARSQQPREKAMTGPRFEQTVMGLQPQPYAAIELIHKQPVRWQKKRVVECDGGGGPLGHPRIFINVDKPQICHCTYCGLPFAHESHRTFLESLPSTTYPLESTEDPAEINESQQATDRPLEQR